MLRSILKRSKRNMSVEDASGRVLIEVVPSCPRCGLPLNGHEYRLIASTVLKPDALSSFRDLLSAIRSNDWQKVVTFQRWEGNQANAEVYGLKCPGGALSAVVISAPFALEEPYTLMHQQAVDDGAAFGVLPDSDTWHLL